MAKEAVEKIRAIEEEAFKILTEAEKEAKRIVSDAKSEAKVLIEAEKKKALEEALKVEEEATKKGSEFAVSYIEENRGKTDAPVEKARLKKEAVTDEVIKLLFF